MYNPIRNLLRRYYDKHISAGGAINARAARGVAGRDRSVLFNGGRTGVLLIHGLGGTPVEMRSVARGLAASGATVLCCQLAGHCGTGADLAATRWVDWYDSAEASLKRLACTCDQIVIGGLSMGALLAARLAALHPDRVSGLVMLAPTLWHDGWAMPWYRPLLRFIINTPVMRLWQFVEREPYGVKDERIRAVVAAAMFSGSSAEAGLAATPGRSIRELGLLIAEVKKVLGRVRQPALVVHVRDDDLASLSNAFYLQRHLGGPVESLILEDSFHLVTVDCQRHEVTERVVLFVDSFRVARSEISTCKASRLQAV